MDGGRVEDMSEYIEACLAWSRGCPRKACQVVSLELAVVDGGGGLANFAGPSRAKVGQKKDGQKKKLASPTGRPAPVGLRAA